MRQPINRRDENNDDEIANSRGLAQQVEFRKGFSPTTEESSIGEQRDSNRWIRRLADGFVRDVAYQLRMPYSFIAGAARLD